jgi:creatinine amidohydrolase/Fe(II)-dependent formamide hydrolase-like protein
MHVQGGQQRAAGLASALSGLSALVLVNGHGGNYVLSNIVQEAIAAAGKLSIPPRNRADFHAGYGNDDRILG